MAVIELDPRFPTIIPLDAASLLTGDVSYTEEVPIRVRWAIADGGGRSVPDADVLVTTNPNNEEVLARLESGDRHIRVGLDEAPDPLPAAAIENEAAARAFVSDGPMPPLSGQPAAGAVGAAEDTEDNELEGAGLPGGMFAAAGSGNTGQGGQSAQLAEPSPATATEGAGTANTEVVYADSKLPRVEEAVDVMAAARATGEWEASQTHASLLPYLIEEAYEFVDAVNEGGDIRGELSDLLLQVLFHAEIAEDFDLNDVADAFVEKMRTRQPYLFDGSVRDGEMVPVAKQEESWATGRGTAKSDPAEQLPALALAEETIRRARGLGIPDSEIPVELMCPTPGLELESGAEARTRYVARTFLAELRARETGPEFGTDSGDAELWGTVN
ncbi:MazG nucleotide pyrophosphohydrolase domain-containing protein [Corynebacterium sp. H113]|uniref:MazG nucleotide pyrophosphohydrolase domain-containing protein n=1 Tax=Corynebacterium sp. H113 TaxID=3133419 RepID=UPI0030B3481B